MTFSFPRLLIFIILSIPLLTSSVNVTPSILATSGIKEYPSVVNNNNFKIEKVSEGVLNFPTSMAFLGPNDILVVEKNTGKVKRIMNGTVMEDPLLDVNVGNKNERGLLGIAVAPKFNNNTSKADIDSKTANTRYVFIYYTESSSNDGTDIHDEEPLGNRLYRYEFLNGKLVNPELILELPISLSGNHNGGKLKIGPDNNIYVVIGDISSGSITENLKLGKVPDGSDGILRVGFDGKAVNPIFGNGTFLDKYFAFGIRNSFGIEFDPLTGNLWDTENGPGFGDEINLVEPGFNSGWRKVQGVWHYTNKTIGEKFHGENELVNFNGNANYSSPEFSWNKTVGVTDLTFLNSNTLGEKFINDIFVGDFGNGYIYHFDINKKRTGLVLQEPLKDKIANSYDELNGTIFAQGFGGITDLEVSPDGILYVLATSRGGSDCNPMYYDEFCIPYSSGIQGDLFKIIADQNNLYTQNE